MTKISRIPVEREKMSLFLDDFWTAVASLESKNEARLFFNQFLTHTERKMFAKRFQIGMMLILGYEYKVIRDRVRVSSGTIARISNWLEENGKEITLVSQRIIRLKEETASRLKSNYRSVKGRAGGKTILSETAEEITGFIKRSQKRKSLTG